MTTNDVGAGRLVAGRYRLAEWLGAGGMGTVWRAYDEVLQVDVAVKEIRFPADLDDAERAGQVETAMREARNAARLRGNPHVVTVHDAVEQDGLPWIVMDYVPAATLAATVAGRGPLPVERAAQVGLGVLDALVAGKRLGVLHRDVKPSNILLTQDGRVLLTDFGIATHVSDPTLIGGLGSGGTPAYLAPERLLGGAATLAGDLFALGATLYLAVEGVSPFQRESVPLTVGAVLHANPPDFTRAGPLAPAISGLLAKSPASRLRPDGAHALLTRALSASARAHPEAGPRRRGAGGAAGSVSVARSGATQDGPPTAGGGAATPVSLVASPRLPLDGGSGRRRVVAGGGSGRRPAGGVPAGWDLAGGGVLRSAPSGVRRSRRLTGLVLAALLLVLVVAAVGRLLLPAGGGGAGGSDLPAGMIGRWRGTVSQGTVSYPVEITLAGGRVGETLGRAWNTRDGCTADLRLLAVDSAGAHFTERLTAGVGECFALEAEVLALGTDATLDYHYPASPLTSGGHAVLRRVSG
ncbi:MULTISPECIES: serine/threonine-protein kinase [Frankia]|uniref:non-specific serine/threonine protein kinase n=1 Tax=Frankia alni (strain DSM 45986 / CECT 9034 / ACN14a) TaxID=326424 RepID=Q0RH13_FRAAA|nr:MULTISPECIES: serine/threonine-protein kinase [Frankia]CAJ63222.1 Putative membrane serine/threonine protein kinase [Frankia alni ACN14a]